MVIDLVQTQSKGLESQSHPIIMSHTQLLRIILGLLATVPEGFGKPWPLEGSGWAVSQYHRILT